MRVFDQKLVDRTHGLNPEFKPGDYEMGKALQSGRQDTDKGEEKSQKLEGFATTMQQISESFDRILVHTSCSRKLLAEESKPCRVLYVSVQRPQWPITETVLKEVFSRTGKVEHIAILSFSPTVEALVQYDSSVSAIMAWDQFHGRQIYDGCCRIDVQFASMDSIPKCWISNADKASRTAYSTKCESTKEASNRVILVTIDQEMQLAAEDRLKQVLPNHGIVGIVIACHYPNVQALVQFSTNLDASIAKISLDVSYMGEESCKIATRFSLLDCLQDMPSVEHSSHLVNKVFVSAQLVDPAIKKRELLLSCTPKETELVGEFSDKPFRNEAHILSSVKTPNSGGKICECFQKFIANEEIKQVNQANTAARSIVEMQEMDEDSESSKDNDVEGSGIEGESEDENDKQRKSALDRLEKASEDSFLGPGLTAIDNSVEDFASGAWQALGNAWKGGSCFVNKLEHSAEGLANSIQQGGLPTAGSVAPSSIESGKALTTKGTQVLELIGKETMDLLITEAGIEVDRDSKDAQSQGSEEQLFEEVNFDRCIYIYGGPEQLEELETLSNHYASLITFSGKKVHAKLSESGLQFDSVVSNSLISLYSKSDNWVVANSKFEAMGELRDIVSWRAMISCFAHNGLESRAVTTFLEMIEFGELPNQYSFAGVLQACSNPDIDWIGEVIFGFVMKTGYFESDVCVGCSLIDPFVKGRGDMSSAQKVFDKMSERNAVVWTLIFTRYAQLGHPRVAVALFMEMLESGHMPDRYTFSTVVSACSELELLSLGEQLHSKVIKSRLASDVCVGCSLVDMYAKCAGDGSMANSRKVFDVLADHNVMSWTSIITGYVQSGGRDKEAIELYYRMTEGNSLISLYARCGNIEAASKVFATMEDRNVVSWTSIITGLASKRKMTEHGMLIATISYGGSPKATEVWFRGPNPGGTHVQSLLTLIIEDNDLHNGGGM